MKNSKYLFVLVAFSITLFSCKFFKSVEWDFVINNENIVYPSAIISLAGYNLKDSANMKDSIKYFDIKHVKNLFDLKLQIKDDNTKVKIILKESEFWQETTITQFYKKAGEYQITPEIRWKFEVLRNINQPKQVYAIVQLIENNKDYVEKSAFFTLRSVNECLYAFKYQGNIHQMRYMFAAYVNEDNADLQQILKEGIETGLVNKYTGYQHRSEMKVQKQVASIWNALQKRGINYSSLTESSHFSTSFYSQRVRSLKETLEYGQANCVDGTVLMASLLKQIGIDPVLVHVPNHMFLGYYTSKSHTKMQCLETTMLGINDTTIYKSMYYLKGIPSYTSFLKATKVANEKYKRYKDTNKIELIEIKKVRSFIQPIGL